MYRQSERVRFFIANGVESSLYMVCMVYGAGVCSVYGCVWIMYFQGHFANIFLSIILFHFAFPLSPPQARAQTHTHTHTGSAFVLRLFSIHAHFSVLLFTMEKWN